MPLTDIAQALAIVLVWGVNFVVIKWGVADVPPLLLGALRFTLAALPAVLLVRRPAVPWRWLAAYALTVGVGQFGLLFSAIKLGMPAGLASVVLQAQAFFTLLLASLVLGERWKAAQLVGLLCALAGLALIGVGKGGNMTLIGFALTVAAALSWAASNVVVRLIGRAGYRVEPLGLVVWSSLVPPVPFLMLSFWLEGGERIAAALGHFSLPSLLAVAYLAFVATLFGYGLWSRLLARHAANKVAPFSLLVPVVGLIAASLLLGERLSAGQAVGSLLLLAGLVINVLGERLRDYWRQREAAGA
ncbi:EamA family transporter [Pseudogulbenkiania subflava]|uniref:O-acetylserine/cysteine efflux transporter n=1 Tax=Pseudogulbenkiania subflava DSM 22618 TaxID=1123014 RepID=A0A1Y6BR45_9NEIS|nr:EamA family transporter [Pseudogulbenkiania subflava]SMF24732.1 O-acetylserine/cysteine efflux transporter [Pseudogulbenkiania subflava DSM 22618]